MWPSDNLKMRPQKLSDPVRFRRRLRYANEIVEGLYIGSIFAAQDIQGLKANGITHVLSVTNEVRGLKYPKEISHKVVPVMDLPYENLYCHFASCLEFIEEGRKAGGVLVHCQAGVSRSATICTAYLMQTYTLAADEALNKMRKARPCVSPNPGFLKQLQKFEREVVKRTQSESQPPTPLRSLITPPRPLSLPPSAAASLVNLAENNPRPLSKAVRVDPGLLTLPSLSKNSAGMRVHRFL